MDINQSENFYLMMAYVYLKSYEDAVNDFEEAVKNIGFSDLALMAVKEKLAERIDRVSNDIEQLNSGD